MGYLNDADRWLDAQLEAFSKGAIEFDEMKRNIREKILESYRNGLTAAGRSPAPRDDRRQPERRRKRSER